MVYLSILYSVVYYKHKQYPWYYLLPFDSLLHREKECFLVVRRYQLRRRLVLRLLGRVLLPGPAAVKVTPRVQEKGESGKAPDHQKCATTGNVDTCKKHRTLGDESGRGGDVLSLAQNVSNLLNVVAVYTYIQCREHRKAKAQKES